MLFLTILLVLFIDRVLWDGAPHREHAWFGRYLARINSNNWLSEKAWGPLVVLVPPLLLIGWLQVTLPAFGTLFEFALAAGILLMSIGPRDLGRDADAYLEARGADDRAAAAQLAEHLTGGIPAGEDRDRAVSDGILAGACHRLIGPLFWFVLFGPIGAAAYRLSRLFSRRLAAGPDPLSPLARSAAAVSFVLDWAPVRVTAAGYAVAGNFDAVAAAWKHCSQLDGDCECPNDEAMLIETGRASLQPAGTRSATNLVEDSLALVWRNLTLWVVFIGVVSLFSSL